MNIFAANIACQTSMMTGVMASGGLQPDYIGRLLGVLHLTGQIPESINTVEGAVQKIVTDRLVGASYRLREMARGRGERTTTFAALKLHLNRGLKPEEVPKPLRGATTVLELCQAWAQMVVDHLREPAVPEEWQQKGDDVIRGFVDGSRQHGIGELLTGLRETDLPKPEQAAILSDMLSKLGFIPASLKRVPFIGLITVLFRELGESDQAQAAFDEINEIAQGGQTELYQGRFWLAALEYLIDPSTKDYAPAVFNMVQDILEKLPLNNQKYALLGKVSPYASEVGAADMAEAFARRRVTVTMDLINEELAAQQASDPQAPDRTATYTLDPGDSSGQLILKSQALLSQAINEANQHLDSKQMQALIEFAFQKAEQIQKESARRKVRSQLKGL